MTDYENNKIGAKKHTHKCPTCKQVWTCGLAITVHQKGLIEAQETQCWHDQDPRCCTCYKPEVA